MRSEFYGAVLERAEGIEPNGFGGLSPVGCFRISDERYQSAVIARLMRSAVMQVAKSFRPEPARRHGHA